MPRSAGSRPAPASTAALLGRGLAGLVLAGSLGLSGCGPRTLDAPLVLDGHLEMVPAAEDGSSEGSASEGTPTPWFLGDSKPFVQCVEAPPGVDTSRWEAVATVDGTPLGEPRPPRRRLGRVLCFETAADPADLGPTERRLRLCGSLVDRFDGSRLSLPCRSVRWSPPDGARTAARGERVRAFYDAMETATEAPVETVTDALLAAGRRAEEAGFPVLAARCLLTAVHFLSVEETPEALDRAEALLDTLPPLLVTDGPAWVGYTVAWYRSEIAEVRDRPGEAWRFLLRAEEAQARVADPDRVLTVASQADLLARAGAVEEARARLATAVAACEPDRCSDHAVRAARANLAWLALLDPVATRAELDEAEEHLAASLAGEHRDPLEQANRWISRAYLDVRRGGDPAAALAEARAALATVAPSPGWHRALEAWARVVEGLDHLDRGRTGRAREECGGALDGLAGAPQDLAVAAAACVARALEADGRLDAAGAAWDRAVVEAEVLGFGGSGPSAIPLGPGQRADAFYGAADLAARRGDGGRAWALLDRLDALGATEAARRRCRREAIDPALRARWSEIDRRSRTLLERWNQLGRSLAADAAPERRAVAEELQALWRRWPGCDEAPTAAPARADLRAVAAGGTILLLERRPDGAGGEEVRVVRRTPFERPALARLLDRVDRALEGEMTTDEATADAAAGGRPDDDAWRALVAPLAAALAPPPDRLASAAEGSGSRPLTYMLHGVLQGAPLAAFPVEPGGAEGPDVDGARTGSAWLGTVVPLALRPAAVEPGFAASPEAAADGAGALFVVDPRRDLPAGAALASLYRDLFPAARLLQGREADRGTLRRALGADGGADAAAVSFLHLDTHGVYEPAVPELSGVALADGDLTLLELAGLEPPRRFVNLAGCRTGRWPTTADGGRYGVAGLFARLGVPWVVASRTDLPDATAERFNREFYRAVAAGASPPDAFHRALAATAAVEPAARWGGLMLLDAAAPEGSAVRVGGQSISASTPSREEEE